MYSSLDNITNETERYMKARDIINKFEKNYEYQKRNYDLRKAMTAGDPNEGRDVFHYSFGLPPNDYTKDEEYQKAVKVINDYEAKHNMQPQNERKEWNIIFEEILRESER